MRDSSVDDGKALLAGIAAGDERAFRKLFELYKERFYSVALKMTRSDEVAQDIVQEIFMNIWERRESLMEIDNPSSYFFTAVYRKVYSYYRKIALEKKLFRIAPPAKDIGNTTDEMVLAHESSELISRAVSKLPRQQQLVFKLSRQEGLSREDIARQLHISPNTVRNHLADALEFIRSFIRHSTFTVVFISWFFKR